MFYLVQEGEVGPLDGLPLVFLGVLQHLPKHGLAMRENGGLDRLVEGDKAVEELGPGELLRFWMGAGGDVEDGLIGPRGGMQDFPVLLPVTPRRVLVLTLGLPPGGGVLSSSESSSSSVQVA